MTLISLLLALGIERLLGHWSDWGRPVLITAWLRFWKIVAGTVGLSHSVLLLPLLLVPPLWLVAEIKSQITSPFVAVALATLLLALCLGPRDLSEDVSDLIHARATGDEETARRISVRLQRVPGADESQRTLVGALFIQSHERLFGVLLWFFVLGPVGAVLYRLASRLPDLLNDDLSDIRLQRAADTLHGLLAWAPARVTALLFGLAGSFDDAIKSWKDLLYAPDHGWRRGTWAVLAESASASLEVEDRASHAPVISSSLDEVLREVLRMQTRALMILLAVIAVFQTGSWIG